MEKRHQKNRYQKEADQGRYYVHCDEHGKQLSAVICKHVLSKQSFPSYVEVPEKDATTIGCISCSACEKEPEKNNFSLICWQLAKEFLPQ